MNKRDRFSAFLREIQPASLFEGFPIEIMPEDLQGFQVPDNAVFFDRVFSLLTPEAMIELGTWKGQSAIMFVKRMLTYCDCPVLACVDTWVGSSEHWTNTTWRSEMHLRWGFPTLYLRFAANIIRAQVAPWITPLPMLTETALALMRERHVLVDAVYVDASHEYEAVLRDIKGCSFIIDETGVILLDDFSAPGVKFAIQGFCEKHGGTGLYNYESSWSQALLFKAWEPAKRAMDAIPGLKRIS